MMAVSSPKELPILIKPFQQPQQTEHEQEEEKLKPKVYALNQSSHHSKISAVLDTRELWRQFDALGTEMIVTRRGRYAELIGLSLSMA